MRVLVVGAGGREHALAWRLARDPAVKKLFAAPGNAGIARDAECVRVAPDDAAGMLAFVERERIDLTVVGPRRSARRGSGRPARSSAGIRCSGLGEAARLEGSKVGEGPLRAVRIRGGRPEGRL
jgi:phosphoribosylamine--glycine ligase